MKQQQYSDGHAKASSSTLAAAVAEAQSKSSRLPLMLGPTTSARPDDKCAQGEAFWLGSSYGGDTWASPICRSTYPTFPVIRITL